MPRSMMTAAFAVMMVAAAPLACAQTTTPATNPPVEHTTASPNDFTTGGGQLRASEIIGSKVYDVQNQNIGSVKDVLLDPTGRVQSVVLDVGEFLGLGGKYVTVSLNDLKTDNNRLTLDMSKDQLQSAPEFHFKAS
jgi:sporulation protein YlmC with PRC-barrel domain